MDRYRNFEELQAGENPASFSTTLVDRDTEVCIIAPHGGKIEPGTSEIARAVAAESLSLYLFEGLKTDNNRDLHITSSNFDEPAGDALVRKSAFAIALHGCQGEDEQVFIGGRHEKLATMLRARLIEQGFRVGKHSNPYLQGVSAANICNRGQMKLGVQLELTRRLRERLTAGAESSLLERFANAIRKALAEHAGSVG